ncbi:MAG TPA: HlyD family efflux transporter periplasmic adaptor subunit [Gemmatimonadales bacterium]|jgi:HlyD family secretion protein
MFLKKHWRLLLTFTAVVLVVVWRLRPSALDVETVPVRTGPLRETIAEDGETRVRDRYVVAAPVTGRLRRVRLRAGDRVDRGEVVAWLEPAPLDARTRRAAVAAVESAQDARRAADAATLAAEAALEQGVRGRARAESLAAQGHVAPSQREEAELLETTRRRELDAARARAETAAHDLERARAALFASSESQTPRGGRSTISAPVAGQVLRLLEESERVILAGTPVLEVGDPARLEVVADLLSTDAVKVRPGDTVLVEEWGGGQTLRARVRMVEPSGFTKVSALGVEEQRVNVVADLTDPPGPLGDRYRVEVRVVLWGVAQALQVPLSALVRQGDAWTVFVVENGRARARQITPGHRGASDVEIVGGLEAGEPVIRYPSDLIRDGLRVRALPRAAP